MEQLDDHRPWKIGINSASTRQASASRCCPPVCRSAAFARLGYDFGPVQPLNHHVGIPRRVRVPDKESSSNKVRALPQFLLFQAQRPSRCLLISASNDDAAPRRRAPARSRPRGVQWRPQILASPPDGAEPLSSGNRNALITAPDDRQPGAPAAQAFKLVGCDDVFVAMRRRLSDAVPFLLRIADTFKNVRCRCSKYGRRHD